MALYNTNKMLTILCYKPIQTSNEKFLIRQKHHFQFKHNQWSMVIMEKEKIVVIPYSAFGQAMFAKMYLERFQ